MQHLLHDRKKSINNGRRNKHEEHKPVSLGKGIWKVGIVREYDPFEEEARKVRD